MSAPSIDLTIDQGDDETILIHAKKPDGTPADLSSAKLWFYVKARDTDADPPLIGKTSGGGGITFTDAVNGEAEVAIADTDTAIIASAYLGRKLRWQVQVRDAAGAIVTLARGDFVINRDLITTIA